MRGARGQPQPLTAPLSILKQAFSLPSYSVTVHLSTAVAIDKFPQMVVVTSLALKSPG